MYRPVREIRLEHRAFLKDGQAGMQYRGHLEIATIGMKYLQRWTAENFAAG